MALDTHDGLGWIASASGGMALPSLGHLFSYRLKSSLDLACQLGHTHVGLAAIFDRRHLPK